VCTAEPASIVYRELIMVKEERYFGKTIAEHFDSGSCWLCGEDVDRSKGYHGATGAHWACSAALMKQDETLSRNPSLKQFLARANGGHFVHTVDPASGASLCGHRPKDTARRMRPRARWIPVASVPRGFKRCPHCARIASQKPTPCASASANTDRDFRTRDLFDEE